MYGRVDIKTLASRKSKFLSKRNQLGKKESQRDHADGISEQSDEYRLSFYEDIPKDNKIVTLANGVSYTKRNPRHSNTHRQFSNLKIEIKNSSENFKITKSVQSQNPKVSKSI